MYVYLHVGACGGQTRASDPLELEKQAVVRRQMCVLGTELGSFTRAVSPTLMSPTLSRLYSFPDAKPSNMLYLLIIYKALL